MSTAELACSYAALILADDGIEVSVRLTPNCEFIEGSKTRKRCFSCWGLGSRWEDITRETWNQHCNQKSQQSLTAISLPGRQDPDPHLRRQG